MKMDDENIVVGKTISVKVEEYLPDIILVSFKFKDKIFQGILLDSTKRQLPCGVYSKNHQSSDDDPFIDKLFSLKQRHTYSPSDGTEQTRYQNHSPKKTKLGNKPKNARMTVRLRPRQVLCSNCHSICNEKSENVSYNKVNKTQVSTGNRISQPNVLLNQNNNSFINNNNNIGNNNNNLTNTSSHNNISSNNNNSRKYRESRSAREARQCVQLTSSTSSNPKELNKTNVNSQISNPVLVPKLVKLKASDIETATSVGISSLPTDNGTPKTVQSQATLSHCTYSESDETVDGEGKLPKLKLVPGLALKKNRGKIPKMTISTNSLPNGEVKDCGIRTRSRGSIDDKSDELSNNKPTPAKISSTIFRPALETLVEKKDNEGVKLKKIPDISKKQKDGDEENENQAKFNTTGSLTVENVEGFSYNLTKLTILPLNSKTSSENAEAKPKLDKMDKMNLRKKRSIGSMEDLWDETVFDENKKFKSDNIKETISSLSSEECDGSTDSEKPRTTPILKISFGPGKGTVLKIPAKSTVSENDSTESEEQSEVLKKNKNIITKAAKKALKRARKEAQKKALVSVTAPSVFISHKSKFGGKSPVRMGGMSPARLSGFSPGRFGGTSPGRFGGASPGRFGGASPGRFGGTSPARFGGSSPSIFTGMMSPRANVEGFFRTQSRKHKHKMKHKKKRKEDRKHKSDENVEPNNAPSEIVTPKEDSGPLTEMTNMDISTEKTAVDSIWKVPSSPDQPLTDAPTNAVGGTSPPKPNVLQSTRHKLSISIKRVSNASYVACEPSNPTMKKDDTSPSSPTNPGTRSPPLLSDSPNPKRTPNSPTLSPAADHFTATTTTITTTNTKAQCEENDFNYLNIAPDADLGSDPNQSSDEFGDIPDFPYIASGCVEQGEDAALLLMKLGWHDVDSCEVPEGLIKVGDIVWGKINDFPWWPAKITLLKMAKDSCRGHAQVCWYGSSASSLLPTESLQPFLKKFHVRYKKRILGAYQDAVREANFDADRIHEADHALNLCESPITASPREVDVVS